MGFFDFLRPPEPPKRGRPKGTKMTYAEKRLRREDKRRQEFLDELRENDPETYKEVMLSHLMKGKGAPKKGELETLAANIRQLRDIGIPIDGKGLAEDSGRSWIGEGIKELGAAALEYFKTQQTAMQLQALQIQHGQPANPALPAPASNGHQPPEEDNVSLQSRYLIGLLERKTPQEAAEWLNQRQEPQVRDLVSGLAHTPEQHLISVLDDLAGQAPDFADAFAWLKTRPQWFLEAVRALRALNGVEGVPEVEALAPSGAKSPMGL